ncbi:dCTP deaminase [Camelimonas lactis]|uniref:dCTP deaminase n=1 Tax=Camelimonas lactis TaxID=659006 RepID=A0A4R2GGT4_9HYPH|nr:dCTP deaminase [Camelimonas lactis]TCO07553.1 dCTP deaminase [Camelimonas lactis]
MRLLSKKEIEDSLDSDRADSLFIEPLLDRCQIGASTVDLRVGYDFLVSILTRRPYISVSSDVDGYRGASTYFQYTRRVVGDNFILYPGQVAITNTLEYVGLPPNMYADVLSRSSYNRLGIHLNTMIQPGFHGCVPLELVNHGNNPVEIVVGSRLVQLRLFDVIEHRVYGSPSDRKYIGDMRPVVSRISADRDFSILRKLRG